jgi:HEAT repeat protein
VTVTRHASLWIALALGACSRESRVDALVHQLEEARSSTDRSEAARALGRLPGRIPVDFHERIWIGIGPLPPDPDIERASRALRRAVREDEDPRVRGDAARSLAHLRAPGPHPELVECALYDEKVDSECARAILVIADPEDLNAMAAAVGTYPRGAPEDFGWDGSQAHLEALRDLHPFFRFPFHELREAGIPYLERVVREDRSDNATTFALFELRRVATPEAYDVVAIAFDDVHADHRAAAVMMFEAAGSKATKHLPTIYRRLADPDEDVRSGAARVLGIPTPP